MVSSTSDITLPEVKHLFRFVLHIWPIIASKVLAATKSSFLSFYNKVEPTEKNVYTKD